MATTRIAVGLIWNDGRLAVGKRSLDAHLAGYDEWPGGKCEPDETPELTVIRECREETGLDVQVRARRARILHPYEKGILEIHFFDCALIDRSTAELIRLPFAWWTIAEVLSGNFPPANRVVLDDLRADAIRRDS